MRRLCVSPRPLAVSLGGTLALILLAACSISTHAANPTPLQPALQFADDQSLSITFKPGEDTKTKVVAVRNDSPTQVTVSFCTLMDTAAPSDCSPVPSASSDIEAFDAKEIALTFSRPKDVPTQVTSGMLMVKAAGVASAVRPLKVTLTPKRWLANNLSNTGDGLLANSLLLGSFGASALFLAVLITVLIIRNESMHPSIPLLVI